MSDTGPLSIREKFIASFGWQALNVSSQVILQLIFISLLARLITPEAFGIMAIALVVVGFIEIFSQIGIGPALIQRKNLTQEHINGAFFISVILGISFTVGLYLLAPAIARFYDHEPLTKILRWIGLSFLISALAIVPRSMIIKEMAFRKLFFCSITAMTVGNLGVGLTLAFKGYDVWAYVFALLSQNILMTITYWFFRPTPIGRAWNWTTTKDMIRYGGGSTLFNMFNYAATKIDLLIVGKFGTSQAAEITPSDKWSSTGVYDRAAYLMSLPITVLGKLSDSVMFSGLSMLQDDRPRLQRAFLSAIYHIALLVMPGSVFMVFFADEITILFLGEQYHDAVPIVQVLFISVAFRSLIKVSDSIVRALDRVYTASAIKALFLVLVGGGTYLTLSFGLIGVAWALVSAVVIQFIFMMTLSLHLTQLTWKRLLKKTMPGILTAIIVVFASWIALFVNSFIHEMRLVKLCMALIINAGVVALATWYIPFIFRQGKDDILETLADKLPLRSLKRRWVRKQ